MPELSIVVPVYNVAPFLRECLASIRRQSFTDFEVFLIDDGSTDGSGSICKAYCEKDKRFSYFYQGNRGVSSARNEGIERARGDFITFVDPDDVLSLDFYEVLFDKQRSCNADVVEGNTRTINEDGEPTREQKAIDALTEYFGENVFFLSGSREAVAVGTDAILDLICQNEINCLSWNKIFRRSLWGNTRYPENLSLGEDMACVLNVAAHANIAAIAPGAVYYYRQRNTSLLHSNVNEARLKEDLQGSGTMLNQLLALAPERREALQALKFQYDSGALSQFIKQRNGGSRLAALYTGISCMDEYKDQTGPVLALSAFLRDFIVQEAIFNNLEE